MTTANITRIGAGELAALIATGGVSAREAAAAHIAAIETVNPHINAVVGRRYAAALLEADAIDAQRKYGAKLPPLAGVPVTIKEALDVEGLPSTSGFAAYAATVAQSDDAAVARIKAAGAIVLAKTNVAQGLIFIESDNPVYGRTSNPWDARRSCGGSSGGEGAIIAAGASPLGLGTDIGGSVRVPAVWCGIASLKPTVGRVPDTQRLSVPVAAAIQSQIGPMARYVADVGLGLAAINDSRIALGDWRAVEVSNLRIGVYEEDGLFAPSPAVRRAVNEAGAMLRDAGAQVVPWRTPEPALANEIFYGVLSADGMAGLKRAALAAGLMRALRSCFCSQRVRASHLMRWRRWLAR